MRVAYKISPFLLSILYFWGHVHKYKQWETFFQLGKTGLKENSRGLNVL